MERLKAKTVSNGQVPPQSVWLRLQKGSLIVIGETDGVDIRQWPTEEEIRAVVQSVHQRRTRPQREPTARDTNITVGDQAQSSSMGQRVQEVLGPFGTIDPWQRAREQAAQQARELVGQSVLDAIPGTSGPERDGTHIPMGMMLVTEKNLNILKFAGELDKTNKVHYTKWARNITDYIESKGPEGLELSNAMGWAVKQGRQQKITDAMTEERFKCLKQAGVVQQLQMLMNNWTEGQAEKAISYDVMNGLDAWRNCTTNNSQKSYFSNKS